MMLGSIQVDLDNTELDTAKDYFGQPLKVGDYVAAAWTAKYEPTLAIYEIKRFSYVLYRSKNETKRLVTLELLRLGTSATAERKADNVIKIDPALLTFKTLKS